MVSTLDLCILIIYSWTGGSYLRFSICFWMPNVKRFSAISFFKKIKYDQIMRSLFRHTSWLIRSLKYLPDIYFWWYLLCIGVSWVSNKHLFTLDLFNRFSMKFCSLTTPLFAWTISLVLFVKIWMDWIAGFILFNFYKFYRSKKNPLLTL